jgi:hypothetical protein
VGWATTANKPAAFVWERDKHMSLTKRLFMAGTAAVALSAFAFRPALPIPVTTATSSYTTSSATVETIIDTPVTKNVNTYSTELTAQIQGGPVLYDQTFPVAYADPVFQSAIGSAESVLTGAGAVSFLGPTLLSSTNTPSSTTNTVQTGSMVTGISVTQTLYIGPQTSGSAKAIPLLPIAQSAAHRSSSPPARQTLTR